MQQNTNNNVKGREMFVEQFEGAFDFKSILADVNISISGLSILQHEKEVNHAFHLLKRKDLELLQAITVLNWV